MRNLLPEQNKKENAFEYHLRLGVLYLVWLAASSFIFIIFLIPSYILSLAREKEFAQKSQNVSSSILAKGATEYKVSLRKAQNEIVALKALDAENTIHVYLDTLLSYKTKGIQVFGISIGALKDGQRNVTVNGNATDRESLVAFSQRLEKEKLFTAVNLPVSDLSKDTNIGFSLTMTTQQPQ